MVSLKNPSTRILKFQIIILDLEMKAFVNAANDMTRVISIILRGTRNRLCADSWFPRKGPVRDTFSQSTMPDGDDCKSALKLRNAVRSEILHQLRESDLDCEFTSLAQMDIRPPEKEKITYR